GRQTPLLSLGAPTFAGTTRLLAIERLFVLTLEPLEPGLSAQSAAFHEHGNLLLAQIEIRAGNAVRFDEHRAMPVLFVEVRVVGHVDGEADERLDVADEIGDLDRGQTEALALGADLAARVHAQAKRRLVVNIVVR